MQDSQPFYCLIEQQGQWVARAVFWRVPEEPLPLPGRLHKLIKPFFRRYPLLVCRSPLANLSGLTLPQGNLRQPAREMFAQKAFELLGQTQSSFAIFDFLPCEELCGWPGRFRATTVSDPGTVMLLRWKSFDAYLDSAGKKDRQHYKRSLRQAEKLGITVERFSRVEDVPAAMALIRGLERRHRAAPNPWVEAMLRNLSLVDGVFLSAKIGSRLVGCGLVLEDRGAQMTTALGLADDVPYVYFALVYESLKLAFERGARLLRWGSGAYEVKKKLGFELEETNHALVGARNPALQGLIRWML